MSLPIQLELVRFAENHREDLDRLRTCFFYLHHASGSVCPSWGAPTEESRDANVFSDPDSISKLLTRTGWYIETFMSLFHYRAGCCVTSDWLAGWFGWLLVRQGLAKTVSSSNQYSPNQLASFHKHLACYFLYLIHWMKNAGNTDRRVFSDVRNGYELVLESKLYLISEYAHVELGLPRAVTILETLKHAWQAEAVLYAAGDFYREHLQHAVDTCILGLLLLDSKILGRLSRDREGICTKMVRQNWVIASLLHDIGYGVKLNRAIVKRIAFLRDSCKFQESLDRLAKSLDSFELDLVAQCKALPTELAIDTLGHGAPSALFVADLFGDCWGQRDTEGDRSPIEQAVVAMARHDDPCSEIDPQREPITFLLFLLDHLQEWERPRVDEGFRHHLVAHLLRDTGFGPRITVPVDYVWLNLASEKRPKPFQLPRDKPLEFCIFYKEASRQGIEPPILWVHNSFEFQRVRNDKLLLDIQVRFVHPMSKDLRELGSHGTLTEIDLFHDFVNESAQGRIFLAAFSEWLQLIRDRENEHWIAHSFPEDPLNQEYSFCETLSIYLGAGKKGRDDRPIPFLPEELLPQYRTWKKGRIRFLRSRSWKR